MSEHSNPATLSASPAVINCRIRALWATGELTAEGRAEYGRLLELWDAAVQAEQELAA